MTTVLEKTAARVELDTEIEFSRASFSKVNPRLQIAHDASSMKCGAKCWRYYEYSIIEGWTLPGTNDHLLFGHLLHSAVEMYDWLRVGSFDEKYVQGLIEIGIPEDHARRAAAEGESHETALLWTLRAVTILCFEFKFKEDGTLDKDASDWWKSQVPEKNVKSLLRTIVWYLDQNKDDNLRTIRLKSGKPAVEHSFRFFPNDLVEDDSFIAPTGEEYIFCGHIDKVAEWQGGIWIVDRKTTKYALDDQYFKQFTPDTQISLYSLAGAIIFGNENGPKPIDGLIIDAMQVIVTGTRYRRKPIERTPEYLREWIRNSQRYLRELERCHEEDFFPMNEEACLSGETTVTVTRGSRAGWKMPIWKLHELFNGITIGKRLNTSLDTYLLSDIGGIVGNQKVEDVILVGNKQTVEIRTSDDDYIRATEDHLFETPSGWIRVDNLHEGDVLVRWRGSEKSKDRIGYTNRASIAGLVNYPRGRRKKWYLGAEQRTSILTVEASINGMSLDEFVSILRTDRQKAATLTYLGDDVEVHHIDEDPTNDSLENLEVLTMLEHKSRHDVKAHLNRLGSTVITSIEPGLVEDVYDIKMVGPYHNFVANSLIAHNCGWGHRQCQFRPICSADPSVRQEWLRAGYVKRSWDPIKPR